MSGASPSGTEATSAQSSDTVVLFDGVCNLCNGTVLFIIDRDPQARIRFTALQSQRAAGLLAPHGVVPKEEPDSFVLLQDGKLYERSTAALRVARMLKGPWRFLYAFIVVPRPLRDFVYRIIARNRYRWFGRETQCRIPTPELRTRFLPESPT